MIPHRVFVHTLRGFLAPVQPYLDDPAVCEIMINGPDRIFIEKDGRLKLTGAQFASVHDLESAIRNIAQFTGRHADSGRPILEARLPDGSRVEAILHPIACNGPCLSIRKFLKTALSIEKLIQSQSLSNEMALFLQKAVTGRKNILVSGGTGSGKTSLLTALAARVSADQRIVVIEDSREIDIEKPHVVYLEARPPDAAGKNAVSIRQLFRATLRLRPDRIIVGEVRGPEAMDMIQAMTSGHGGCLTTVHGTKPLDALRRLETLCLMSDLDLPLTAIRQQVASGIDIIVQTVRYPDGRRAVSHITGLKGLKKDSGYRACKLFCGPAENCRS